MSAERHTDRRTHADDIRGLKVLKDAEECGLWGEGEWHGKREMKNFNFSFSNSETFSFSGNYKHSLG